MRSVRRRLFKQRKFRQLLLALIIFSVFLGILIVSVESQVPEGQIRTIPEGIWWAATTVTAVGYGDYVPVTGPGRVIGVTTQVVGVLMFGLLIAMISTSMTRSIDKYYWEKIFNQMTDLEKKIDSLSKHNEFMAKKDLPRQNLPQKESVS